MSLTRVGFIDGREASLEEFLSHAERLKTSAHERHHVEVPAEPDGEEAASPDSSVSGRKIPEGQRNDSLNAHLFGLRKGGATDDEVEAEADRFNREALEQPLDREEVNQVVKSVLRVKAGLTVAEQLEAINKQFALCILGDSTRILWLLPDGSWKFLRVEAFLQLFENRPVRYRKKNTTLGKAWMQYDARRAYSGVVFEPGDRRTPEAFNLFRGWAKTANASGHCSLFLDHIRDNCARGNSEHAHWMLSFFADIFQHPDRKKGTALVLTGPQGTGKSIVGAVIGKLLGPHYLLASHETHVTGKFNAHQEALLLLHSDEATFAGDHASAGRLKDMVTGQHHVIERKGVDAIRVANFMRLLVTSEQPWVVPASLLERRFAVFELNAERLQDTAYFGRMMHQLEHEDGYEALLFFLLNYEYDPNDLRTIPNTEALAEQKQRSLPPEDAWMLDILVRAMLPGDKNGTGECSSARLYASYIAHAAKRGVGRRSAETLLGNYLKRRFGGAVGRRQVATRAGGRFCARIFPPLEEARDIFAKGMRWEADWDEPSEWVPDDRDGEGDPDEDLPF